MREEQLRLAVDEIMAVVGYAQDYKVTDGSCEVEPHTKHARPHNMRSTDEHARSQAARASHPRTDAK